jgi:hypothetical protein
VGERGERETDRNEAVRKINRQRENEREMEREIGSQ